MTRTEREQQAEAFLAWHIKHHGGLRDDFDRWAASKRFASADYLTIWRLVHAEAVARGELVYTRIDGEAA